MHPLVQDAVTNDDDRDLEPLCQVEGIVGQVEGLPDVAWREDGPRELTLGGVDGEQQVRLLGTGGQAGGGAGTLPKHHDEGDLGLARQAQALGHQAKAPARGASHGAGSCRACTDGHHDGRYLVLGVLGDDAELLLQRHEPVEQGSGRRHGVTRVERHARLEGTQSHGLVARHDHMGKAALGALEAHDVGVSVVLLDVIVARPGRRYVHVDYLLALGLEMLAQHLLEFLAHVIGQGDGHAQGDGVAHQVRPAVLPGDGLEGYGQEGEILATKDVLAQFLRLYLHGVRVVDYRAAIGHVQGV